MHTPTPSCYQKTIKKLNNIVIARLTTNRSPNILSDTWKFDTSTDWKILEEEFEMWPANLFPNVAFTMVGMHVTNPDYLEERPLCFTELLDSGIEKSNRILVRLDKAAVIPETDNQDLPDLINLELK